ncbi:hypothetical protein AYO22_06126 [Fonsecaea multimorphosa]|nr:hypothetical protein AYO22_06126 [Fonsecaea multimorphosa]
MLGGLLFCFWRFVEIVTLIPVIGMLAWFVNGFNDNNQLTPSFILTLFIVSILACAWALVTLLRLGSTRRSAIFVAFVDLLFVGAFIAADVELRGIDDANCSNFTFGSIFINLGPFGYYGLNSGSHWALHLNKNCALLKASWALGIMNTILFFFTFILALFLHRHERVVVTKENDLPPKVAEGKPSSSYPHPLEAKPKELPRSRRDEGEVILACNLYHPSWRPGEIQQYLVMARDDQLEKMRLESGDLQGGELGIWGRSRRFGHCSGRRSSIMTNDLGYIHSREPRTGAFAKVDSWPESPWLTVRSDDSQWGPGASSHFFSIFNPGHKSGRS